MRATQPLNETAVCSADDEIYARHERDQRPNALFELDGRRKPLDADDPAQESLRAEWMESYQRFGGKTETRRVERGRPLNAPVVKCPHHLARLTVQVTYTPYPASVASATVELTGPTSRKALTDTQGFAELSGLEPGLYSVTVGFTQKHPLVEEALKYVDATDWAVQADRDPYPAGKNKCNLFVYETANKAGYHIPIRTRFSFRQMQEVWYPPLAGEFADDTQTIGAWSYITEEASAPGDLVAEAVAFRDATGHVGIISYPIGMSTTTVTLQPDEAGHVDMTMQRQVISAGGDAVLNNDYFWSSRRHGTPHYKRYFPPPADR